jgi:hypothetical protein
MLQPKVTKSVKKSVKKYNPTVKEKKNIEDATQMKNMRPTGPSSGRIKPSQGSAKNGKPVKKAFLGSLLGGAGGGKGMLGGMGKKMLGGLMGGGGKEEDSKKNEAINSVGPQAAAISKRMSSAMSKSNMPKKSTDMTPVRTRGMMKKGGKVSKAKSGTSLGMKSVKAGFDKNPGVTRADIITAATKKAKSGTKMKMGGSMKKCKYGCK